MSINLIDEVKLCKMVSSVELILANREQISLYLIDYWTKMSFPSRTVAAIRSKISMFLIN
jgi:hypothetical protein